MFAELEHESVFIVCRDKIKNIARIDVTLLWGSLMFIPISNTTGCIPFTGKDLQGETSVNVLSHFSSSSNSQ